MDAAESPLFTDKDAIADALIGGGVTLAESMSEDSNQLTPMLMSQGSQELRERDLETRDGGTRSAEKVLDISRRCRKIEGVMNVGTDDNEVVEKEFAENIRSSIIALKFDCYNTVTKELLPYNGQAGFVLNPNTEEVMFATCKHNFGNAQVLECSGPHKCVLYDYTSALINLPNTGWVKTQDHALTLRDGAVWSNGFDLSLGPVISENTTTENWPNNVVPQRWLNNLIPKVRPFKVVDEKTFTYEVGLKIAVVVYNHGCTKEEAFSEVNLDDIDIGDESTYAVRTVGIKKAKMEAVLGEKDSVMIYTGYITHVGTDHIEYNVNTHGGCSGGVGLVMTRGHAEFGNALSIHAGFCGALRTNIGFKLAGAFDREEQW